MPGILNLTIESLLSQQIELIGPGVVSLDSLWRVAGCPPEQSPRRWTVFADPLIAGFVHYFSSLPDRPADFASNPLIWVWDGEDGEPWRTGDLMAHSLLARIYASFLDSAV
jgi:hypothetical protein